MVQNAKRIFISAVSFVAVFAVFFGLTVILAVLDKVSWDEVWSWNGDAAIIAGIMWLISTVVVLLISAIPKKSTQGKK